MFQYQVLDDLLDASLGSLHAVLGALECDAIAVRARAREADSNAPILLGKLSQHLPSPAHKVAVMPWLYHHAILHHIILRKMT